MVCSETKLEFDVRSPSLAFVTPSFPADLARCELLVESLDRFAPAYPHYLLLDEPHVPLFRHLESERTRIIPSQQLIGEYFSRLPGDSGYWVSLRTLPVRGWMTQQLRKLAVAVELNVDIVICVDSDTAFIRPFELSSILEDGRIGLLDVGYQDEMITKWTRISERLLKLPNGSADVRNHVGHLVAWHRPHLIAMLERLEAVASVPWPVAIARRATFSEYTLYGVYVRSVLGYGDSQHAPSERYLVRQPWDHDFSTRDGLRDYIAAPHPDNIAVMVHSKFGIPAEKLRPHFLAAWDSF